MARTSGVASGRVKSAEISLDFLTSCSSLRDASDVNVYVPEAVGVNTAVAVSPFFAMLSLATSFPFLSDIMISNLSHASANLEPIFILAETVIVPSSATADVSEGVMTELHGSLTTCSNSPSATDT